MPPIALVAAEPAERRGPDDDVRLSDPYLVVAAGTAVSLARVLPADRTHLPVLVRGGRQRTGHGLRLGSRAGRAPRPRRPGRPRPAGGVRRRLRRCARPGRAVPKPPHPPWPASAASHRESRAQPTTRAGSRARA